VFYHGYEIDPITWKKRERISPMFDGMLARGYAVIQSGYSATGWAVEEAAIDTERLRKYFIGKHGQPKETFITGLSMGGTLTAMAIETQPERYDGAFSMCGALEPTNRLMQRDFAVRAAFDFYFPGVLGALDPVAGDFVPNEAATKKAEAALKTDPAKARALLGVYGAGDLTTLADIVVFNTYEIKEMQQRAGGNPFGNADFIYMGSGDDFALNDGVRRYRADTKSALRMSRFYTPGGKLTRPFIALHDVGDPLVPASTAFEYALAAQRAGYGDNFVQQYVNAKGHCVFKPEEIDRAFGELLDWVHDSKRPVSGRLPATPTP
jgi:pimeloyl-ACP methyl ester carboxylesterase